MSLLPLLKIGRVGPDKLLSWVSQQIRRRRKEARPTRNATHFWNAEVTAITETLCTAGKTGKTVIHDGVPKIKIPFFHSQN